MSQTETRNIVIELPEEQALEVESWLRHTSDGADRTGSHGRLDLKQLAGILLEDAHWATRHPGSWEGDLMLQLLRGHGYDPLELQSRGDDA